MDEEAEYRAALSKNGMDDRSAQAQGPLMDFFAGAIRLEAALITQREILREFERIVREGQHDAAINGTVGTKEIFTGWRQLLGRWRSLFVFASATPGQKREEPGRDERWMEKEKNLRSMVTAIQRETQHALETLYAGSGLPVRYRTLPALVSFYEYFQTGRCNTLSGGEGAYSVFDAEVRAGTAALQADEAWARREAIGPMHPMLLRCLTQSRETARRVAQEAAQAGTGADLALLPEWSAFARGVRRAGELAEND